MVGKKRKRQFLPTIWAQLFCATIFLPICREYITVSIKYIVIIFLINSSRPEEELVNIQRIGMDSVTLNMRDMVYQLCNNQHWWPLSRRFICCTVHINSIYTTLFNRSKWRYNNWSNISIWWKFMSPEQENSCWYLEIEVRSIYDWFQTTLYTSLLITPHLAHGVA